MNEYFFPGQPSLFSFVAVCLTWYDKSGIVARLARQVPPALALVMPAPPCRLGEHPAVHARR